MAAKKKKGKKKKKAEPKGPIKLEIPSFVPSGLIRMPIAVKVHHFDDVYLIYTDEYKNAQAISDEITKITGKPNEEIKLYMANKRWIDKESMNHDQQITHNIDIYASFFIEKKEKLEIWDDIKTVIVYNMYSLPVEEVMNAENAEERRWKQLKTIDEDKGKTKKKKKEK